MKSINSAVKRLAGTVFNIRYSRSVVGHRSNHLLACGIHSDAGVVHVAGVEHGSSCLDGRSGEEGVHNHVHMVVVRSPYNHMNVAVDDSHFVGCIHHFFWESVSFVAFLQKQKIVKQDPSVSFESQTS